MYEIVSKAKMKVLRAMFLAQLEKARKVDHDYCKKVGVKMPMDDAAFKDTVILVEGCRDPFELKALEQFLYSDNVIPDEESLRLRAFKMRSLIPLGG